MAKQSGQNKAAGGEVSAPDVRNIAPASPTPSRFHRDWLWGLVLVLAVILAYTPVWRAGFIWDDDGYVAGNPCVNGLSGLKEIWTTSAADISPLTITTFGLEYALWGAAPRPYHLVNVLLHAACAVLLWRVLRNLQAPGAWLGAALWAVHPVEVESVAWVSEMKNTQSGLFFLLSILFFVRWLKARAIEERADGGWSYALSLLFAALAMAGKSSTVILPVVLCLCAWWMEGRWQWRNLVRTAPVFLMSAAASALSIWTQGLHLATVDPHWARTWPQRVAAAGDAVWFYLGKLLWPHPLITIYPRWEIDAGRWSAYLPLLAVIVVLFLLWFNRATRARPWFFVFAYFLAALLPALGLFDNPIFRHSLVFDHFQYLASMGPLALAGAGLVKFGKWVMPDRPGLQWSLGAGALLVLGLVSWQRTRAYENEETLWTDTLAKNPNCWLGHNNLGDALSQKGEVDEAIVHYRKALEINPHDAQLQSNLGMAFFKKGRFDEAMARYDAALEIDPGNAPIQDNLGNALLQKGKVDEAMGRYQLALQIDPNFAMARYNLGNILVRKGRVDEAIVEYQKAVELDPRYADAHYNLGVVLLQKGEADEAATQFQDILRLNPDDGDAQKRLAQAEALARQNPGLK